MINLINGLFDTGCPPESTITYNRIKFENNRLKKILADTILTINGVHSYHIEAQMTDPDLFKRLVFEVILNNTG